MFVLDPWEPYGFERSLWQNQPALEKGRYKIRQAFIAAPGNSLIVADYGQLELRILAHLANCKIEHGGSL
ncbi:hypothetical protein PIB30_067230 [Stylosanthes scabra]|uniref:DNA-directed DNA polymerase family A palm domain-containing protein n=1 Tax=Stylosanthes scabra TaxID=79078 RepID=A0ABU6UR80_9FABA|nr:hypothetical protein [Stylosanthes scabra]